MKSWKDDLREDELALYGTNFVTDRLIERIAQGRKIEKWLLREAERKGFGPHELIDTTPLGGDDLKRVQDRIKEYDASESGKRTQECRDKPDGHQWTGPHDGRLRLRLPAYSCSHCGTSSEAWQHAIITEED